MQVERFSEELPLFQLMMGQSCVSDGFRYHEAGKHERPSYRQSSDQANDRDEAH